MEDQVKVGELYIVEQNTLGKVSKVGDGKAVVVCLDFPYFRLVNVSEFVTSSIKVENNVSSAITNLVLPNLNNEFNLKTWKTELENIVEYVLDDIETEFDEDVSEENAELLRFIRKQAKIYLLDSAWLREKKGQERCIEYAVNYLDVLPDDILRHLSDKNRHNWESVRKATALANFMKDIETSVLEQLSEDSELEEDTESEYY